MKQWMLRASQVIGLVLLLVTLTAALRPTPVTDGRKESLALRQMGHDYLSMMGDVSSRIPAVIEREDGTLVLKLNRPIDYDTLAIIGKTVIAKYGIWRNYTLALEDCGSGEVILGSLWEPTLSGTGFWQNGAACLGREQLESCANIALAFAPEKPLGVPVEHYFLGGLGMLLLVAGSTMKRVPKVEPARLPEPADQNEIDSAKQDLAVYITPNCSFQEADLLLTINGTQDQLTYREAKLLAYLTQHTNQVMDRSDIHDAVWGEEGLITGRSLDVFISRLRKKLAVIEAIEIQTVHGIGYRFRVGTSF